MKAALEKRLVEAGLLSDLDIHDCEDDKLWEVCNFDCYDQRLLFKRMRLNNRWSQLIHAHSALDHIASEFLFQRLPNKDVLRIDRWGLQQKIDLLHALGLCGKPLHSTITFLNSLRNKAAHRLNFSIEDAHVSDLLSRYPAEIFDSAGRKPGFVHALVVTVALLEGERQRDVFTSLRKRGAKANARRVLDDWEAAKRPTNVGVVIEGGN
ncbi:hypothetical protein [Cereibacter johrii]|uniref:hypothetical protein n=1 Tax=Cereibacter johrii TaxID=445629 RepID=UPI0011BEBF96|nr:hypothetical protein [Cereibacter johrii]